MAAQIPRIRIQNLTPNSLSGTGTALCQAESMLLSRITNRLTWYSHQLVSQKGVAKSRIEVIFCSSLVNRLTFVLMREKVTILQGVLQEKI